jgi:hypothetical protein
VQADPNKHLKTSLALSLAFLLAAIVIIASGRIPLRSEFDQKLYHLPAVRGFFEQWPSFNVYDYLSASTPGYHIALAAVAKIVGWNVQVLQVATAIITLGLVWIVGRLVSHRREGIVLALPVIASSYVLSAGVFILPDNAGWLCVSGMLLIALTCAVTWRSAVVMGLLYAVLVATRQSHAWALGLAVIWGLFSGGDEAREGMRSWIARVAIALAACVPGTALLVLFVCHWDGLVPARFQHQYPPKSAVDIARSPALVYVLAVVGFFSPFFAAYWWRGLVCAARHARARVSLAGCAWLVLILIAPTTFDYDAGRRTGLWNIAARFPEVGHVSIFIAGLSFVGTACVVGILSGSPFGIGGKDRLLLGLTLVGFSVGMSPSSEVWQRYIEPFVLIWLAATCARAEPRGDLGARWWPLVRVGGPLALSVMLGAISAQGFVGSPRVDGANPPTRSPDDRGVFTPPAELAPIPTPAGKRFWRCP